MYFIFCLYIIITEAAVNDDVLQKRLDKTAGLLKELQQTQHDRLSQKPPPHLGHITGPGEKENNLGMSLLYCFSVLI